MDHELAVNVPVDISRPPYDLEGMGVSLVVPADLGVLEVRNSPPVCAIHSARLVSDLLHVDFGYGVCCIEKARRNRTGSHVCHPGGELERAIGKGLSSRNFRTARQDLRAVPSLLECQDELRADTHIRRRERADISADIANPGSGTTMRLPGISPERELTRPTMTDEWGEPLDELPFASSPALWGGAKGMFPPPQPTKKSVANTKTVILCIEFPFETGDRDQRRIPCWPEDCGAQEPKISACRNTKNSCDTRGPLGTREKTEVNAVDEEAARRV
jgi:hypothetical protein